MSNKQISREDYAKALRLLAEKNALNFLEMLTLSDIEEEALGNIIAVLKERGFVDLRGPEDNCEQIITLKRAGRKEAARPLTDEDWEQVQRRYGEAINRAHINALR